MARKLFLLLLVSCLGVVSAWAGDCVAYSSCFCRCMNQGTCCRNGCWSNPNPSGCGNQCNEIEGACEDDCAATFVSDGTVCPTIFCYTNPFCNAP